ncbi:MAG: DNA polymerase III subunit alpha [Leptospiraceae bacterium]|nr:DNA polymerase III subunit alpha [Leptospiraceae bacterium]
MQESDFTHLHLHTTYSMLDGAIHIPSLVKHVKSSGMSSVAVTDHGNMYGAIEFYKEATKSGVKPIIGSEFYVSANRSDESELDNIPDGNAYHLILLAKNQIGYQNLIKLSSRSFTEGFYKKPRIDYDLLSRNSDGLVCLTACLAGEVPRKMMEGKEDQAGRLAYMLNEIFHSEDFYLEIQDHGIPEQNTVAKRLNEFSKKSGIPLILTNDSHFLKKDDQEAQDILLRIGTKKSISDAMPFGFNSEFYVKTPAEMAKLFPELPDAYLKTLEVRDKCNLTFKFGENKLPDFKVPDGFNEYTYLEKLVEEGLTKRYSVITEEIRNRVTFEMNTVRAMNFAGYFLIVQDYINFAKKSSIPVGPGRGSAAGSIVAYAIGMTNVDPLKYGLLFERFLNPDRKDMPDVDTDFCVERREEVINYIKDTYGENKVGQIITFNSLAAKAALKDVARVLNLSFTESNEISKAFPPPQKAKSIEEALEISQELRAIRDKSETHKKVFAIAQKLEGNYRQPGRHAAGVVISPLPMETVVPLATVAEKGKNTRSIVTQYDKDQLESVGLIKMDILGLNNLTTLDQAIRLVEQRHKIKIDLDSLPLDDPKTYSLLKKANTLGVFQLESSGITDLVAKSQVNTFEEIVALIALYRPGPMDSGMLQDYLDRKSGKQKVTYPHSSVETVLKETFGVAVYQEQVMSISRIIGGFSMGESDMLRKAMAKKKVDLMEELKAKFITGATAQGHESKFASDLFDLLEKFGGYGFNKSHSVAYALITYQTAYFKANYPTEFMTALLASEQNDTSRIVKFINNAKEMGIKILFPDVCESDVSFSIPEDNTIRFGISALKGVGLIAGNAIVDARKKVNSFKTLTEFLSNVDPYVINKKVIEALIQAGALDSFGYTRKCLFESIDYLLSFASQELERKRAGQGNLFGAASEVYSLQLPKNSEEWEMDEKLKKEKAITGLFLTGHPLDKFKRELSKLSFTTIDRLDEFPSGKRVELCGIITVPEHKFTKKNEEFVNFKLEDYTGDIDCTIFPKSYQKFKELIKEDEAVFLTGVLDKVEIGEAELKGQVLVNSVEILNETNLESKLEKTIHLIIDTDKTKDLSIINSIHSILTSFKGNCKVFFHLKSHSNSKKVIRVHDHFRVEPIKELFYRLSEVLGKENIFYSVGDEIKPVKI